jgi:hypothetical protein
MRRAVSATEIPDVGGRQVAGGRGGEQTGSSADSLLLTPVFTAPDPSDHSLATRHYPSKNVKNEDRTDYVYENKVKITKCTPLNPAL